MPIYSEVQFLPNYLKYKKKWLNFVLGVDLPLGLFFCKISVFLRRSDIKKAQNESPTSPDVHQMKALLHEALHEPKEALGSWKKCLKYSKDKKVKREAKIHIRILSEE